MDLPNPQKIMSGIYLIAGIIILFVIYKLMTGLGLIKTRKSKIIAAEKAEAVENLRTTEIFNPDYGNTHSFAKIGNNAADLYAEQLRKAMKGFGTSEEVIFTIFGSIKNKGNISEIANRYYLKFKRNLIADILNELTDKETVILNNIIKKLPII